MMFSVGGLRKGVLGLAERMRFFVGYEGTVCEEGISSDITETSWATCLR